MATRSTIAVRLNDGSVRKVYCHWDGYLEHNGVMLVDHYNTQELAELVTSLGDISFLDFNYAPTEPHSFQVPQDGVTILYGRDRGETETEPRVYPDIATYEAGQMEEYNYLFIDGEWYYKSHDKMVRRVKEQLESLRAEAVV